MGRERPVLFPVFNLRKKPICTSALFPFSLSPTGPQLEQTSILSRSPVLSDAPSRPEQIKSESRSPDLPDAPRPPSRRPVGQSSIALTALPLDIASTSPLPLTTPTPAPAPAPHRRRSTPLRLTIAPLRRTSGVPRRRRRTDVIAQWRWRVRPRRKPFPAFCLCAASAREALGVVVHWCFRAATCGLVLWSIACEF